jgi:DNA polymerase I-like protein with 3'-5' exonuclease and polymerase domains
LEDILISENIVLDLDRLEKEIEIFGNHGEAVYDVETIPSALGADDRGVPSHNQVLWLGMKMPGRSIQIPMGHPIGTKVIGETKEPRVFKDGKTRMFRVPVYEPPPEQLTRSEVFPLFNKLANDPNVILGAHGATFDNGSVAKYNGGRIPSGKLPCTLVMRWLTDENRKRYGLKYITKDIYKFVYDDEEVGKQVEKYPFGMVAHYLHCDVTYTWFEYDRNKRRIEEQGLSDLFDMETDLVSVLSHMRTIGVRIDTERLESLREELAVRVEQIEGTVYAAAGKKFNINAPLQKQALLWLPKDQGGQGLKPWKLTDGGRDKVEKKGLKPDHTFYSTDEESLEEFKGNPLVDALLDYQEHNKVLSTYVYGYLGVDGDKDKPNRIFDSRIFPDFVQYGAATGRFSCRAPNLQNVPAARTDLGKLVRGLFIADPGWKLIVADYGQVELVILAHLAGQGKLFEGFHNGIDPHTMTAAMVLGKHPKDVTKNERQRFGKSLNFAVVYGAGVAKVASMAEISKPQAKALLAKYHEQFPEVGRLRTKTLREARRHSLARTGFPPHTTTIMGRMRRLPGLNSADDGLRSYNERQAFNARIQGSSADITKRAMIRYQEMKKPHWQLLLTIHDELVTTAPAEEAEEAAAVLVDSMAGPEMQKLLTVPLTAEPAIVDRWSEAKD